MKKRLCLILTLLSLGACSPSPSSAAAQEENYRNISPDAGFDTIFTYGETTADTSQAKQHYMDCVERLSYYNQLFDIYNDYEGINNIKTINDQAGIAPVKVDPVIIELLQFAKDFYDYSDGAFDITMGSVLKIWHTYRMEGVEANENNEKGKVPSRKELEEAALSTGWDHLIIDEEASTVYIDDAGVSLDVGGIAKGFATEKTAEMFTEEITGGFLNMGGNVRTTGPKKDGSPWSVSITDPSKQEADGLARVYHEGIFSSVTSGDYERYYEAEDGNTYHHIIDPDTLFPADLYHSVSIFTKDSGAADCLSTILFTLTIEEGKEVLSTYTKESGEEVSAVWIMDKDKTQEEEGKRIGQYYIVCTDNLSDSIAFAPY